MPQRSMVVAAFGVSCCTIALNVEARAESPHPSAAIESAAATPSVKAVDVVENRLDLAGDWILTLPAGFQYRLQLQRTDDGRYAMPDSRNMTGVYERRGDKLYMSEPIDERHNVFTWRILNANTLTLIDETGASGARYAGATLCRQFPAEAELPRVVPTVFAAESQLTPARWARADAACFADTPVASVIELTGTAHNDALHGAYVEGERCVVLIRGLDAWPEQVELKTITVSGTLSFEDRSANQGTRTAAVVRLSTYQLPDGPVQRVAPMD